MLSYGCLPLRALGGGVLANRYGLASPWIVSGVLNLAATAVTVPLLDPLLEALTGRIHSRRRCKRHANHSDPSSEQPPALPPGPRPGTPSWTTGY